MRGHLLNNRTSAREIPTLLLAGAEQRPPFCVAGKHFLGQPSRPVIAQSRFIRASVWTAASTLPTSAEPPQHLPGAACSRHPRRLHQVAPKPGCRPASIRSRSAWPAACRGPTRLCSGLGWHHARTSPWAGCPIRRSKSAGKSRRMNDSHRACAKAWPWRVRKLRTVFTCRRRACLPACHFSTGSGPATPSAPSGAPARHQQRTPT